MLDGARPGLLRWVHIGDLHNNELANDGRTVYATTRSTGQIEEGPVGFSIMTLDRGVVSWRFKPLHSLWPFVMITSPADHRLAMASDYVGSGDLRRLEVMASAWSAVGVSECRCRVDDGSDADRIGPWPERHLFDTQLGPNRNGRHW